MSEVEAASCGWVLTLHHVVTPRTEPSRRIPSWHPQRTGDPTRPFSSQAMCSCEPGPAHQTHFLATSNERKLFPVTPCVLPAPQTAAMVSCACFCFTSYVSIPFPICPLILLWNTSLSDVKSPLLVLCALLQCWTLVHLLCHIPWSCVSSREKAFLPHNRVCVHRSQHNRSGSTLNVKFSLDDGGTVWIRGHEAEGFMTDFWGLLRLSWLELWYFVSLAGVGTRNYYRKMGYRLQGPYMVKKLK